MCAEIHPVGRLDQDMRSQHLTKEAELNSAAGSHGLGHWFSATTINIWAWKTLCYAKHHCRGLCCAQ